MTRCTMSNNRGRFIALWLGSFLLTATTAHARQEVLQWTHPSAVDVQRFEAYFGLSSGAYGSPIDLGKPTPDGSGIYQAAITVGDNDNVFIVMRAVGNTGALSDFSAERARSASTTPPTSPPTTPPATPGPGSSEPSFNFDSASIGAVVPGWVDTRTGFSLVEDDSLFSVASSGSGGAFTTASTQADIHSHMAVPAPSITRTYRLSGSMSLGSASGGIGVTAYSGYPTRDAYYRLGRLPGETFKLTARHAMSCSLVDSGYMPTPGGSYSFEIQIESLSDRNRLRIKIWTFGNPEPIGAQIQCDDTSSGRPTGGTFGVWSTGAGSKFWDNFVLIPLPISLPVPPSEAPPAPPILIQIVPVN